MKRLGEFVKKIRKSRRLSMRMVCEKLKKEYPNDQRYWISDGHLSWLENGKIDFPNPFVLRGLAAIYGVSYRELYVLAGYEPEMPDDEDNPDKLLETYLHRIGETEITPEQLRLIKENLLHILKIIHHKLP